MTGLAFDGRRAAAGPEPRLAPLRVPLAVKLVGANVAVVVALLAAAALTGTRISHSVVDVAVLVVAAHVGLVMFALRPIRELEFVAKRVWRGDYGARVSRSRVADHEVLRVGSMFNVLLDGMAADRARMRQLARNVIEAGEQERAALAHQLQDSTAQHMAALLFELSAVARDVKDPRLAQRLDGARDFAGSILEEIRFLSRTVHSAVLDDLGLAAALKRLARDASEGTAIDFDVDADLDGMRLPRNVEATLYRVAQEAIQNATRHASPKRVHIAVHRYNDAVVLEVHDDGAGFDTEMVMTPSGKAVRGLASMRERLSLVDGVLEIKTAKGNGTTVSATIPVDVGREPFE